MIIRSAIPLWWMTSPQFADSLQTNVSMISQSQEYGTGVEQKPWQNTPWFAKWQRCLVYHTVTWLQILIHLVERQGPTTLLLAAQNWSLWWKMVGLAYVLHLSRESNSVCSLLFNSVHLRLVFNNNILSVRGSVRICVKWKWALTWNMKYMYSITPLPRNHSYIMYVNREGEFYFQVNCQVPWIAQNSFCFT